MLTSTPVKVVPALFHVCVNAKIGRLVVCVPLATVTSLPVVVKPEAQASVFDELKKTPFAVAQPVVVVGIVIDVGTPPPLDVVSNLPFTSQRNELRCPFTSVGSEE